MFFVWQYFQCAINPKHRKLIFETELRLDKDIIKFILFFPLWEHRMMWQISCPFKVRIIFHFKVSKKRRIPWVQRSVISLCLPVLSIRRQHRGLCWILTYISYKHVFGGGLCSWKRMQVLSEETSSLSVFLKEKVVGVITCFSPAIILITVSFKEEIQTFTPHQRVLNKLASRRLII